MKNTHNLLSLVVALLLTHSAVAGNSPGQTAPVTLKAAKTVSELAEGKPALTQTLGEQSFVPVEVEKLAHARVWFVDYDWHRQHGIQVPADGIHNAEFAQAILDAYGWQNHSPDDPADAFTGETKTSYADYYGGFGMGANWGSGRAVANGIIQIKGVKSSLAKSTDPFHSNGAVQSIESVDEAIWSQILDSEMKYGSNKVIAVILTGTYGRMKNGQVFPRALIIREMAVRPAHFMLNYSRPASEDRARVTSILPQLLSELPYPENYQRQSPRQDLRTGIMELVDREAITQAEYYAKRMFFGSVSPSNLEITGRRLDLGDHTSQEGYSAIYRLDWQSDSPFGGTASFVKLFEDFRQSLAKTLPADLAVAVPNSNEVAQRFKETFQQQQRIEMLRLSGVPHELLQANSKSASMLRLGELLVNLAKEGNSQLQFMDPQGWANQGRYNVNRILTRLAESPAENTQQLQTILETEIPITRIRNELAWQYFNFRQEINREAQKIGMTTAALQTYFREAAKIRNESRPSLVRGDNRWRLLWDTTDRSIHENSPAPVENYIQEQVAKNVFNFKDVGPYQVVLSQTKNAAEGVSLRKIYDAKKGEYESILRIDVSNGSGYFKGKKYSLTQLQKMAVEAQTESGPFVAIRPTREGNFVEFTFPQQSQLSLADLKVASKTDKTRTASAPRAAGKALMCSKVFFQAAGI